MFGFVVLNVAHSSKPEQHLRANLGTLGQAPVTCKPQQHHRETKSVLCSSKKLECSYNGLLLEQLHNARTRDEYRATAHLLDKIQGHELWKADDESDVPSWKPAELEKSIEDFTYAMKTGDVDQLRYLLRTSLRRDIGQMNALAMYKHSWSGTKILSEEYISIVVTAIRQIVTHSCTLESDPIDLDCSLDTMRSALFSYGRSALAISGGAKMGMKSIGVVKALWEMSLLPKIIYGASAGSIIAAVTCTRHNSDLGRALEGFPYTDLACFDPPDTDLRGWWWQRIRNLWYKNRPFHMENMARVMQSWFGNMTFQEAYNISGRILNISVSSAGSSQSRMLNKDSAPNVLVWSAVCASCSVPGLFPIATVYTKNPTTKEVKPWIEAQNGFLDGSLYQDIPTEHMISTYNINWLIVSQVNPHARFFISLLGYEKDFTGNTPESSLRSKLWEARLPLARLCRSGLRLGVNTLEAFHVPFLHYTGLHLLTQEYVGDIDIFPDIDILDDWHLLSNPTSEYMCRAAFLGEKATWAKLWRIENSLAVELALSKAISDLKQHQIDISRRKRDAQSRSVSVERPIRRDSAEVHIDGESLARQRSRSSEHLNSLVVGDTKGWYATTRRSRRMLGTFEPLLMTSMTKQ